MKLTFHNISKSYGSNLALQNFSATMEPGIYALLGPNGSGKTTLMNILTDNLRADTGHITFEAEGLETQDIKKLGVRFRERVGYMPQYPGMYANFTVEQFLWYMAALKDVEGELKRSERKSRVQSEIVQILDAVELSDVAHKKISALSGGMKQRLALAQAILGDPDILVLDEPTAGLDPKQRIAIRNYISQIALNKIVIFATHVVSDIEFIARRVIMLKKGVILHNTAPQELIGEMEGKVWRVCVPEQEVNDYGQRFRVTSIHRDESDPSRVVLRVVADSFPEIGAIHISPTLEDYYLYTYGSTATYP